MPLTNARADARVAKAVGYMNTFLGVTVPDAMKLAFSKEEKAWMDKTNVDSPPDQEADDHIDNYPYHISSR